MAEGSGGAGVNRRVVLAARPDGVPGPAHFAFDEAPVPAPGAGEMLLEILYASVDPAMKGWIGAAANYSEPVPIGGVMRAHALARVAESRHPGHAAGDILCGWFGWQQWALSDGSDVMWPVAPGTGPLAAHLGVLGLNGVTAYFGLLDVGAPKAGETVVVSTAAGAVGSAVGQIARIKGCRAVGIAGGPEKVAQCLDEFGYDAAVDYKAKTGQALDEALAEACPEGVDVYFDNTAGAISDAVLRRLAIGARVVICGTASVARWDPPPQGPRVERQLLIRRARMQGFLVLDYFPRAGEAIAELSAWIAEGRLAHREDIVDGLEAAPAALAGLYEGRNRGKMIVRVAPDAP